MDRRMFEDFELFGRALIASKDVDPTYPVVKSIIREYNFEPAWFVFVYVSFYNLGSAIRVCQQIPTRHNWDRGVFAALRQDYPHFGHERRGTSRNVDVMINHLEATFELLYWIENLGRRVNVLHDNKSFRAYLETLPNVGNWASFKLAELFEKSLGYEALTIPDLGLEGRDPNSNDGPIGGLRWLTGRDYQYDKEFFEHWNEFGFALRDAWGVDIGEVETVFCKWHKFVTGKYFIGHDIQEFVDLREIMGDVTYDFIMFEDCGFDEHFLKDDNGYRARLQKELKGHYKNNGEIIHAHYADLLPKTDALDLFLTL